MSAKHENQQQQATSWVQLASCFWLLELGLFLNPEYGGNIFR
jgi:hypothetical protein